MTGKFPHFRHHSRKRKNGKVVTYYFYDRRGQGEPDIPLGTDYDQALAKWKEIRFDAPRIAGTIEEAFKAWELDEKSGLLSYANKGTRDGYKKQLRRIRPVFGPATWESVQFIHLTTYLDRRSAKTQGNREMSLLQVIWNWARKKGYTACTWPAAGMERSRWKNKENAREFEVTDMIFTAVYLAGDQVLQDAMDVSSATGMRLQDTISVILPMDEMLRLRASKTKKKADFDLSLSAVLPSLIARRRSIKADHLMLVSTPTGKRVSYNMLRDRWEFAREWAALNMDAAGEDELAAEIRAMFLRDMRSYASDQAETDEEAAKLLQHSSINVTRKHYRNRPTRLKVVR
ncbi:site-specific integrase [Orrella dioscoreae]|uniref:Phage-related integrase n=1 Tax=Orrella dioscoreae TaxID=1851544 RepID=A0A1C3K5D6_9BURK|nr:integrase [Orrella dioscoreae]SBT26730.1 Phage-related integrase [Orrella dioscoreae]SOE48050.1 Phage-related integrase [Orrella dioscoreae]